MQCYSVYITSRIGNSFAIPKLNHEPIGQLANRLGTRQLLNPLNYEFISLLTVQDARRVMKQYLGYLINRVYRTVRE
jgi:hypothetical protein